MLARFSYCLKKMKKSPGHGGYVRVMRTAKITVTITARDSCGLRAVEHDGREKGVPVTTGTVYAFRQLILDN